MNNYLVIDTQQNKCVNVITWDGNTQIKTSDNLYFQLANGNIKIGDLVEKVNNVYQKASVQPAGPSPVDLFSVDQFVQDLLGAFSTDANILVYYAVIKDLAAYKNFSGMKNIINGLLSGSKITNDELTTFNSVLANQNINLNNF